MAKQAFFAGLVYDERGEPVQVRYVGDEAHYAINDDGFLRHVAAEEIDRPVLRMFLEQLHQNKDLAIGQAMQMLGKDDIFTKAALDAQIRNVDMDTILQHGLPTQARDMLGMMGFRIVVNYHGEVVRLDQPAAPGGDEGDDW